MGKSLRFRLTEKGLKYLARARRAELTGEVWYPTGKANALHQGGNDPAISADAATTGSKAGMRRGGIGRISPERS